MFTNVSDFAKFFTGKQINSDNFPNKIKQDSTKLDQIVFAFNCVIHCLKLLFNDFNGVEDYHEVLLYRLHQTIDINDEADRDKIVALPLGHRELVYQSIILFQNKCELRLGWFECQKRILTSFSILLGKHQLFGQEKMIEKFNRQINCHLPHTSIDKSTAIYLIRIITSNTLKTRLKL